MTLTPKHTLYFIFLGFFSLGATINSVLIKPNQIHSVTLLKS